MTNIKSKTVLTLEGAKTIAEKAEEKALELNVGGAIAIVDDSGNLIYLESLDGTMPAAANIAIGKAATAAAFKRPTKNLEQVIQQKRLSMLDLSGIPNTPYVPLMGGYPIFHNNEVIGAVSVAGAQTGENDEIIAQAAIEISLA